MSRTGIYKRGRRRIPDCQEGCNKGLFDFLGGKLVVSDRQNLRWKQGGKANCCLGVPAHALKERVKEGMQYCSDDRRRWPVTTTRSKVSLHAATSKPGTAGSGAGSKHFWIAAIRSTSASMYAVAATSFRYVSASSVAVLKFLSADPINITRKTRSCRTTASKLPAHLSKMNTQFSRSPKAPGVAASAW